MRVGCADEVAITIRSLLFKMREQIPPSRRTQSPFQTRRSPERAKFRITYASNGGHSEVCPPASASRDRSQAPLRELPVEGVRPRWVSHSPVGRPAEDRFGFSPTLR